MDERKLREQIEKTVIFITDKFSRAENLTKPVLCHSLRVGFYLYSKGYPVELILSGFLHDTIEDTGTSLSEIEDSFGKRVADLVNANTKNVQLEERTREMIERCVKCGEGALIVKAADVLENCDYSINQKWDKGLKYCPKAIKLILEAKPDSFADPIFDELNDRLKEF